MTKDHSSSSEERTPEESTPQGNASVQISTSDPPIEVLNLPKSWIRNMFGSSKTRDNPSRANPLKVSPISANPSSGYLSRYHPAHGFMGQHNLLNGQQIKATENRSSPMEAHQPCLGQALPAGRIFFMRVNHFTRVKHPNRVWEQIPTRFHKPVFCHTILPPPMVARNPATHYTHQRLTDRSCGSLPNSYLTSTTTQLGCGSSDEHWSPRIKTDLLTGLSQFRPTSIWRDIGENAIN